MIVTLQGIVVFPYDPVFNDLTEQWMSLPSVMEHKLVRQPKKPFYLYIQACVGKPDYYAIQEKIIDDIRRKAPSSSP